MRHLYKRPAVDVNMAPGIISATTNAASALVADMTAPEIQVDGAGGGRTGYGFPTNVSSSSGDGGLRQHYESSPEVPKRSSPI